MESVIAIGVVAILLSTFLAVFGPATQGIRRAISTQEADRLAVALERELSILRSDEIEQGEVQTAFDKAYRWIEKSSPEGVGKIYLYNYKGDPSRVRADGSLNPVPKNEVEEGNYVATPRVRLVEDGDIPVDMISEMEVAEGPVFLVTTKQLVFDDEGKLVPSAARGIVPPQQGQAPLTNGGDTASGSYPEAVIAFTADFYVLKSTARNYLENLDEDAIQRLGRPLFSRSMGVRR
jgi:hypothetical protein